MVDSLIADVSDTSYWVAHYRAVESARPQPLFVDPFAARLAGDKGARIAATVPRGEMTEWSVAVRTVLIDQLVGERVQQGADAVLCLGAGLDARPYRLTLPETLSWVEVDYPAVLAHKQAVLHTATPRCQLHRWPADLSDAAARCEILDRAALFGRQVLVLTEGVVPYLSLEQAGDLADALLARPTLSHWITEYFAPAALRAILRRNKDTLCHAPFRFTPDNWLGFFAARGWKPLCTRYLPELGRRLGRRMPLPWYASFLTHLARLMGRQKEFENMAGFMLLQRR